MKKLLSLALFLFLAFYSFGIDLNPFFKYKYEREVYVVKEEFGVKKIVIPFHFNKASSDFDFKKLLKIRPGMIRNITYTYADNASKSTQSDLNTKRISTLSDAFLNRLNKHASGVFYETCIQTKETSRRNLFTGFVISFEIDERGLGNKIEKELKGEKVAGTLKKSDRIFQIDTLSNYDYYLYRYQPDNSNQEFRLAINKLNKYKHWKKRLIVTDVTGSMYPYNKQVLLWLKLNYKKNGQQYYVFFNDGDGVKGVKKDKVIGKTGGVYYCSNDDGFDGIVKTAAKAMNNGARNYEVEENDVEAVIKGIKKFDEAKNIVLIADNNAAPRDSSLLTELNKPVRVILCGVKDKPIRTAYLNLAFRTKGSIHTMEQDLFFSVKTNEGKIFEYLGKKYIVKNERLVAYTEL